MSALLSLAECAEDAQVSEKTLRREVADGRLPVIRIRGRIRIAREAWEGYLQQCQSANTVTVGKPEFSLPGADLVKLLALDRMPFRGKGSSGEESTIVSLAERRTTRSRKPSSAG
jgi:excisionase family DNA binding protein